MTALDIHETVTRTSKDVSTLVRSQQDQAYLDVLDWITPTNYADQHNDFMRERLQGTGVWFLNSPPFQEWLTTAKRTLFCPGIPGAGKTIISATVIDYIYREFDNSPTIRLAYIYCNFRQQGEQRAQDILASLLKQLATGWPSLPQGVRDLFNKHQKHKTRPSLDEIVKALVSVATGCSRVFVVVDALDECKDDSRGVVLKKLFELQTQASINTMATSRIDKSISRLFSEAHLSQEI